jgi:hypothetical protein
MEAIDSKNQRAALVSREWPAIHKLVHVHQYVAEKGHLITATCELVHPASND